MAPEQQQNQREKRRGTLTIFAGYFTGCGKTWTMVQQALAQGEGDLAVAMDAPGRWPRTDQLIQGLEQVAGLDSAGTMDLDACLKRRPRLLLVEDLAHTNPPGARHRKRYQDIEELLKAGIDVYTTLDLYCIESLRDTVRDVWPLFREEGVPDRVFDRADRVEFVDLEPALLLQRLKQQTRQPLTEQYTPARLSALRELALRRCADRAALYTGGALRRGEYRTREHILVCLSSAPSNQRIIRTAARMAGAFRGGFTALFVETRDYAAMGRQDKERLQANIRLAEQLGASIETVYGDDVAEQIAEFSRLSGVTKIVLGRSVLPRHSLLSKATLTDRLIALTPQLDIHIIPDGAAREDTASRRGRALFRRPALAVADLGKIALFLALSTALGGLFRHIGLADSTIIPLYLLGVMLVSVFTQSPVCSFLASAAGVLTFNFFFTQPRYSLHAYDPSYPVTFLVMFLASLLTGSLATRLKSHAKQSAQVAWRTKLLFETSQSLQKAHTQQGIMNTTARQLVKIFQRDVVAYLVQQEQLAPPQCFPAPEGADPQVYTQPREQGVAQWVLVNNKRAGAGTETFSQALCTYLSVRTGEQVYGVVGVATKDAPLDPFEESILLSVLGECALALENQRNLEEKEAAAVLAKNEQLRANLLRSISHDLRTPLTSISGNASNLLSNGELFDQKTKQQMYGDIYEDSLWLINLVENLLSVSRLEEGKMNLHLTTELVEEVVGEALRHVSRKSAQYHLETIPGEEYLLARMDARLIVQVLINLVDNALKYTPPGSHIQISWEQREKMVYISVADDGPGIPPESKAHIFDMFYSASHQIADSRRSMGLGLALCKSIVNAHGGEITLEDHLPHGCIFTFSVPAGEVELHE